MDRDSAETWPLFIEAPRRVAEYGSNRMESVSDPVAASEVFFSVSSLVSESDTAEATLICRDVAFSNSVGSTVKLFSSHIYYVSTY